MYHILVTKIVFISLFCLATTEERTYLKRTKNNHKQKRSNWKFFEDAGNWFVDQAESANKAWLENFPDEVERNTKIDTIWSPGNKYKISFKLQVGRFASTQNEWTSVLRLTSTTNNCCNYGDRWLAFFFYPNSFKLHTVVGFTGKPNANENDLYDTPILVHPCNISPERTYLVEVTGSNHFVSVLINECNDVPGDSTRYDCTKLMNHECFLRFNTVHLGDRPSVNKLDVYASDKFYKAAPAGVYDFDFTRM